MLGGTLSDDKFRISRMLDITVTLLSLTSSSIEPSSALQLLTIARDGRPTDPRVYRYPARCGAHQHACTCQNVRTTGSARFDRVEGVSAAANACCDAQVCCSIDCKPEHQRIGLAAVIVAAA